MKEYLYKTTDNTLIQVREIDGEVYDAPHEIQEASREHRLLEVNVLGDFPYETRIEDFGYEVLDSPIKDWTDVNEIANVIPFKTDLFIGDMSIEEYKQKIPQVDKIWQFTKYHDYDNVQIRDLSSEYSAITRGIIYEFNPSEVYDEIAEIYGHVDEEDFVGKVMDEVEGLEPWQRLVVSDKLYDVYSDIEQIKEREQLER